MPNDIVTVFTNLFRMYIIWRFAGIFLDVEQAERKKQIVGYGIFYLVNSTLFVLFHSPLLNAAVNLAGTSILYSVLYQGTYTQRLLAVGTMYGGSMAADVLVVLLVNPDYVAGTPISPLASLASILAVLILEVICEYSIKKSHAYKRKDALRLLSIPVISIGIVFYMLKYYIQETELIMVIFGGIMLINIVVLYYYNQIQSQYMKEYKQRLLQRQVQEYEMQLEHMKRSGQEIRRMKHDLKHLAFVMEKAASKDNEEVKEILSEMNLAISDYEELLLSGNSVLDSILNFMQEKARQAGAVIHMDIKVSDQIPVKAIDLNIILGNLLENAVEAVAEQEDKAIRLRMKYDKGSLLIHVCNRYDGILRVKNGKYLTKKEDKENHGIGLENVKRVVEKYDGDIKINTTGNKFDVIILLICKL